MSHRRAVLTALALSTSVALAAAPATAVPGDVTAPQPVELDVICDGIGADTVTVTGDLADGGTAKIERGPLRVVGRPGFTGTDADGDRVAVAPSGTGTTCTVQEPTRDEALDEVLPRAQAAKAAPTGDVTGALTFTVTVDDSVAKATRGVDSTTAAQAALPFESELRRYLGSRPGAVGVAVRLPGTGRSWTYTKTSSRNVTASIVKVQIMSAVMIKAQEAGRGLTSWEKSKIVPMIRYSDNNATTALFDHIGGRAGLDRAGSRLGMTQTYADPYNHWGLTSTTAFDQARLMEHYARPSSVLSYSNRVYGLSQMRQVTASQDWGVSAGPPAGTVALKNGWLPRTDGWHVNSIGWSNYGSADYTIGVLTHDDPGSMGTQISTIEGVSRIVYKNRLSLLPSTPPAQRGARGDLDGDGRVDLMGTSGTGRVYVMKGNGSDDFGGKTLVKSALSDATWFGHAGDVNRDGRSDVLVRRGDGRLQLMYATSTGQLGVLKTIATGWGSYTDIASGLDVDGNGRLDVVNRKVGGYVDHYELSDSGTLKRVRSMGRPARYYPNVELVQDVDGDGRDDLRGIASGGRMRTWTSQGTSWSQTAATSTGWDTYRTVLVPGDVNGSSTHQDDIVAVLPSGRGRVWYGATGGGHTSSYHVLSEGLGNLPFLF
ncbi:FG-GAP-like repeat-containing protein [Janibacter terrae]|uniref:FG-GAP-like repeat-containing protein n=1 Tax=Janibacter terrae TaxID=103817 RepID=UPI00082B56F6|nr:FG-GAP-like repeat-containing protein [Janibacter terrae]